MRNYSGGKLLGKGSSSCVFTPEFPCKNKRKKNKRNSKKNDIKNHVWRKSKKNNKTRKKNK
jgi:hypothetical protein